MRLSLPARAALCLITLATLNQNSEVVAMRASGLSAHGIEDATLERLARLCGCHRDNALAA